MKRNRNKFICIGAVHIDYILMLQKKHFKNRTNPIIQKKSLGGVAYNIALKLSNLGQDVELNSLNCENEIKINILKNKIQFYPLSKSVFERSYSSVLNKNGELIIGLANMIHYEKANILKKIRLFNNKKIIIDLNLSKKNISFMINKYAKKNIICVCGTSAHKVYKIKDLLNKINIIILNKQECLSLTKKITVKSAINYLINKNKNLTTIISDGKNKLIAYHCNKIYSCNPPKVKIRNENGAGDTMSAFFNYFITFNNFKNALIKSIVAGSLHANCYKVNMKQLLKKIDQLSKKMKVKTTNL